MKIDKHLEKAQVHYTRFNFNYENSYFLNQ